MAWQRCKKYWFPGKSISLDFLPEHLQKQIFKHFRQVVSNILPQLRQEARQSRE